MVGCTRLVECIVQEATATATVKMVGLLFTSEAGSHVRLPNRNLRLSPSKWPSSCEL